MKIPSRGPRCLLATLLLITTLSPQASGSPSVDLASLRQHPRLLIDGKTWAAFRTRLKSDAELARRYALLKEEAVALLKEPPIDYAIPDGKRLLRVSREVMRRVYTLALTYHTAHDRRFLDRAWKELEHAGSFKDWNPKHFLDTAEMTHAFAIGYDWLHADLSDKQRAFARDAMIRHGLKPGLRSYRGQERYGWWVTAKHNWNQVCNGGLLMGALAIADEEPALAKEIITAAVKSLPRAMNEYAPTGGYKEGPAYWGYGSTYNVLAIASLESALGESFGLANAKGFDLTGHFPVHMTSPTGYPFNFADCKFKKVGRTAALYWLAHRYDQPLWRWHAEAYSREKPKALDLLWREPPPKGFDMDTAPRAMAWPVVEAFCMRGRWTDKDATFVGFKAGHPADNHAQADLGSFVLDAEGVRWAVDLGPDNYNLPGYFDRDKRRWHFYRNRAEGHNTLVFSPSAKPDQAVKAKAKLIEVNTHGDTPFAIADLTPAYAMEPVLETVWRGVMLINDRDVLVQDEITTGSSSKQAKVQTAIDMYWFMHTAAAIKLSNDGREATLTQQDKTLRIHLLEPTDAAFTVMEAKPFKTSPSVKGQQTNKGYRKLTIRLRLPASRAHRIAVWLSPNDAAAPKLRPLNQW